MATDSGKPIRKFPRLATGAHAAAFARMFWIEPEVRINFRKEPLSTRFTFTVAVPLNLRKAYPTAYRTIFEYPDWEGMVTEAFKTSQYGGKPLLEYISLGLHRAFIGALEIWLAKPAKWGPEQKAFASRTLEEFKRIPQKKSGPQPSAQTAWWAAKRFDYLRPRVTKLRRTLKRSATTASQEHLMTAISEVVPWETAQKSLTTMLAEQGRIEPRQFFLSPGMTNRKITSAIVGVELEKQGHDLKRISLPTYLRLGRQILSLLDGVPPSKFRPSNIHG